MIKKSAKKSKKTNSISVLNFDLLKVRPITDNQEKSFNLYNDGKNLILYGSAGTGKSWISLYLALNDMINNNAFDRIIIIRSAVSSRSQGFLPGTIEEKMESYELPYKIIVNKLFGRDDAYGILKQKDIIQFESTSYLRGLTFDNSLIFVDEVENMNFGECDTIASRIGENSRLIIAGDIRQCDLNPKKEISGMMDLIEIAKRMSEDFFGIVEFDRNDIVRSDFCKQYIIAKEDLGL